MMKMSTSPISLIADPIVLSFVSELESRKRKSSNDQEISIYEGSWAMRPTPPTSSTTRSSSEETSALFLEDEENKDEMLDVYRIVIDSLLQSFDDEEETCQLVRDQLSIKLHHHDTVKSNEIRHRLLKHFQAQGKEFREFIGLRRLLNVVLDENMEMVEIPYREEDAGDCFDDRILPILVKRCPGLQILHLHCTDRLTEEWPHILGLHMSQFKSLTSLHLDKVPYQSKTITSILGKCCPLLKWLRIGFANFSLSADDLLGIFFSGDLNVLRSVAPDIVRLTEQSDEMAELRKEYHRCHVPSHLMYPFCQTLEEVRINHFDSKDPYVIAFILRHLPHLRQLETSDFEFKDYSASIRVLWDIRDVSESEGSSVVTGSPLDSDSITLSNFRGHLALTSLFIEGDTEYQTFKSICDLCPNLQKLHILESSVCASTETQSAVNAFTLSEIANDFKKLNKLRVLICTESDGPLCTTIAQATAPFLTTLEMVLDDVFIPKFDFLIACTNLQVLKLSTEFHPPLKSYFSGSDSSSITPETFLPKLEEVQLEFCMNSELEELFLKKSTLKHIDVLCLHHLGKTDEQFLQLFLQWPHLVSFKYKMPRKFTVDMGLQILAHLPHLRSLSLYKDIKYRCSGDFNLLKKTCRQRNVNLDLHLFVDTYLCIDGDINDELVSTSDESETDS